ncbi:hypothetical protein MUU53_16485 [Rhizobium lemnae]|uniref:Cell envelope biogenesis protein OmpA n=1 Tax=Rhizobium lemnae TaxID=1214924 RepID=A0ABV8E5C8_9HYPH|nr:hypothetical protein [Rhizobium lemnae]MCJ8509506.1 hypothetical protein [Rhizobium lemnae]
MFPSAFTHNITQIARTLSMPERFQHSPLRNLSLEHLRRRNATLDTLFYDVKCVSAEEAFYISSCLAAEGAILIVPPTGAEPLRLCDTVDDFFLAGGAKIETLAIAGVGSSALGSAALGRNIADATGKPVAVVISGYGIADAVTEAMGGSFLFGYMNSVRHAFERLDEFFGRPQFGVATRLSTDKLCQGSLDTQTVRALLVDPRLSLKLIVGHSKGNLVLAEALSDLADNEEGHARRLAEALTIVTISARIAMPLPFRNAIDIMGEWDWFGELNSRKSVSSAHIVPQAMHHTNTELPNHIPVTAVLEEVLARVPGAEIVPTVIGVETDKPSAQPETAESTTSMSTENAASTPVDNTGAEQADTTYEPSPVATDTDITRETLLATTAPIPAVDEAEEKPVAAPLPYKPKRGFRRGK